MSYPNRLLPQPGFKRVTWDESLRKHYLIHFTETKDLKDSNTGKLHIKHVVKQTDHLRDYSNNLLGVFLTDDIYWALKVDCSENRKTYLMANWQEKSNITAPKVPKEFYRNKERGYFFLPINQCHGEIIKFEDNICVSPVCHLLHTPINCNFWHFSLRWFFDGKDLESWSEGIKRRMKTAGKAFIIEKAFFDEPHYQEIDASLYTN